MWEWGHPCGIVVRATTIFIADETQDRPVFGLSLVEHLRISKREIAVVLETCCNELRKEWMDTEGLFRIAGGQSRVKFLKVCLCGLSDVLV